MYELKMGALFIALIIIIVGIMTGFNFNQSETADWTGENVHPRHMNGYISDYGGYHTCQKPNCKWCNTAWKNGK